MGAVLGSDPFNVFAHQLGVESYCCCPSCRSGGGDPVLGDRVRIQEARGVVRYSLEGDLE